MFLRNILAIVIIIIIIMVVIVVFAIAVVICQSRPPFSPAFSVMHFPFIR